MSRQKRLQIETLEVRAMLAGDVVGPEPPEPLEFSEPFEFASVEGTGNNVEHPEWGSTEEQLLRLTSVDYADGISLPAGAGRPGARVVSNSVVAQSESVVNDRYLTDILWLWGQFIDHDIDLTENADPTESHSIQVPAGDAYFDPAGQGGFEIGLNRSIYDEETGESVDNPRQQLNMITALLDGSVVYGSDQERANALRTFEGGRLAMADDGLLPWNEAGLPNANPGVPDGELFLAGDVRANENAALTAMHTLWVREHNRLAEEIGAADPSLTDEVIYQQARSLVTAEIQAITFNEFLPALLGFGTIEPYQGYDPAVNPNISNIFSTAAYRFGHSMLSSELLRLDPDGTPAAAGNLDLASAFFAPQEIVNYGIDSLLLGATAQPAQEIDTMIVDDVRNFLFGPPGAGGFDLASLNIQRGRDHGLADYNQARIDLGLSPVADFSKITSDVTLAAQLQELYGDVDDLDVWVGGLAEDHLPGSSMGELFTAVIADQFRRIRDGDRFWYQNVFAGDQLRELESTRLSQVIERNTDVSGLRDNVFFDESVMYVDLGAQRGGREVAIVIAETTIDIVDARAVIDSRAVDEVEQVMIVGSDAQRSEVMIDIRTGNLDLEGGIVVFGGDNGGDRLLIRGGRGADTTQIDERTILANGGVIDQTGFESVRVLAPAADDSILMVDGKKNGRDVRRTRDGHGGRDHGRDPAPPALAAVDDVLTGLAGPLESLHEVGDVIELLARGSRRRRS